MNSKHSISVDHDDLHREQFVFSITDDLLVALDSYTGQERKTKRSKFRVVKRWESLDSRGNTVEEPKLTDDMKGEAIKFFADLIIYPN